tara:strand:+ start:766 stop:957 length:192 start_codon:yes stop_codon:yes gene_type:complete
MTKSPCINICFLSPKTNLCLGCGRSVEEISSWINLSKDEKKKILTRLKKIRVNNSSNFNNFSK